MSDPIMLFILVPVQVLALGFFWGCSWVEANHD